MKKVSLLMISIASVLFLMSCGSKPAPEETKTEAPVVQEVQEESVEEEVPEEPAVDTEALLVQIEDARKLALAAGAEEKAPELLKHIDTIYEAVRDNSDAIASQGNGLVLSYQTLADYINAKDAKQLIDDNNFAADAQKDYNEGVSYLKLVEDAYEAQNWDASNAENANKAYGKFKNVIFIAYKKLARIERAKAMNAKHDADGVKAGVSQKESYKKAVELLRSGDSLYAIQNPEKAYENYKDSKESFKKLHSQVSEKRASAQLRLEEAKKRVEESALFAAEADAKAPITEQIEGIEEESTVLLEEDSFVNPEEAEIDVPDVIEGAEDEDLSDLDIEEESELKAVIEDAETEVEAEAVEESEITEDEEVVEAEEADVVEETEEVSEELSEEVEEAADETSEEVEAASDETESTEEAAESEE